jgi:hypothetical protein
MREQQVASGSSGQPIAIQIDDPESLLGLEDSSARQALLTVQVSNKKPQMLAKTAVF